MAADGSVLIVIDTDVAKAENDLAKLKNKVFQIEQQLEGKQKKKNALQDELDRIVVAADEANKKLAELNEERERVYRASVTAAAKGGYNDVKYAGLVAQKDALDQQIAAQEQVVAAAEKQMNRYDTLERQIKNINDEISKSAAKLEEAEAAAGKLEQDIEYAKSAAGQMEIASAKAAEGMEKFNTRVSGLASRVFVFSMITSALSELRDWLTNVIVTNDHTAAALSRLSAAAARLAQPLLNVLIPAFVLLADVLTWVINLISAFISLFTGAGESADGLYDQADAIGAVGGAASKASKQLAAFDTINKLSASGGGGGGGGAGGALGDLSNMSAITAKLKDIAGLVAGIGAALGAWSISKVLEPDLGTLARLFDSLLIGVSVGLIVDSIADILFGDGLTWENILEGVVGGAGLGLMLARKLGNGITWKAGMLYGAGIGLGLTLIAGSIRSVIDKGITWESVLTGAAGGGLAGGLLASLAGKLGLKIKGGALTGGIIGIGISLAIQAITSQITEGVDLGNTLLSAVGFGLTGAGIGFVLGGPGGALIGAAIGVAISFAISAITANWEEVKNWFKTKWDDFIEFYNGILDDNELDLFDRLLEIGGYIIQGLLGGIVEALSNLGTWVHDNVVQPLVDGVKSWLGIQSPSTVFAEIGRDIIAGMLGGITETWHTITDFFTENFPGLTELFTKLIEGIKQIFNGLMEFLTGVFTLDWETAWNGVKEIFKGAWNGIIGFIEGAANIIVSAVNALIRQLNKIKVSIPDWVPVFGGKSFGINIKTLGGVSIPRLAQGAVIPPNQEFLAVLGDQKSGTNIEAPLSTIKQAVLEALAQTGGGSKTIVLQVDGREFASIVFDLYGLESQRLGVQTD